MAKKVDEIHEDWPSFKATVIATEKRMDIVEDRLEMLEDAQGIRDSDRRISIANLDLGEDSPTGTHRVVPAPTMRALVRAYRKEQDARAWRTIKRLVRKHAGKAILVLAASACTHIGHPYITKALETVAGER